MKKYLFLFLSFILISCQENSNPITPGTEIENLFKSWTNSFEVQGTNSKVRIFRPSDYKEFPLSRYREVLIFEKDNTCSYLVVAPTDGLYFEKGKWSVIEMKENIFAIFDSTQKLYKKFQIVELRSDLLKFILIE